MDIRAWKWGMEALGPTFPARVLVWRKDKRGPASPRRCGGRTERQGWKNMSSAKIADPGYAFTNYLKVYAVRQCDLYAEAASGNGVCSRFYL